MGMFDLNRTDPTTDDRTRIDPDHPVIAAFNDSQQQMLNQNAIVMRELMQTIGKASEYAAYMMSLPANMPEPVLLAGYDLSRMKMQVSTTNGQTVIGQRESVSVGQGFYLPTTSPFEVTALQDIWVRNLDNNNIAYVSVWIEKSAQ